MEQACHSAEFRLALPGLAIAGTRWGAADAPHKVLCLHGWLDCAATFAPLAAALLAAAPNKLCIVAIDLPGHGQSGHYASSSYSFLNYTATIVRVLEALQWRRPPSAPRSTIDVAPDQQKPSAASAAAPSVSKSRSAQVISPKLQPPLYAHVSAPRHADSQVHVVGHSMGCAIALLTAGLLAGEIDSLCLLDAFFGWGSDGDDYVAAFHAVHEGEWRAHAAAAAAASAIDKALLASPLSTSASPPALPSSSLSSALATATAASASASSTVIGHPAVFASIDAAAQARQRDAIAASFPRTPNSPSKQQQKQPQQPPEPDNAVLSLAAARLCVQRSLRPLAATRLAASSPAFTAPLSPASSSALAASGFVFAYDPNVMAMTYRLTPLGIADALLARADAATPRIVLVRASVQRPHASRAAAALAARQTALLRNTLSGARVADAAVTIDGAHHVHVQHADRVVAHALRAMGLAIEATVAIAATGATAKAATTTVATAAMTSALAAKL